MGTRMSGANDTDVMIGGLIGWTDLSNSSNVSELLATGRVGLYVQESLLDPRNDDEFGNPSSNGTITGVFGLTPGETGNEEYEGDFYAGMNTGYWNTTSTELDLNFPIAALPANNLALPDATTVNFGGTFDSPSDYYNFWNSASVLSEWSTYVTGGRQDGVETVMPIFAPNGFIAQNHSSEWDPNFLDSSYAGLRQMAIEGGGLAIDAPPGYAEQLTAVPTLYSEYITFVEQEIEWADQQGLKSSLILCPYGDDATFSSDVKNFVGSLEAAGAIPAQFVVENYNTGGSTLGIGSDTDPNSLAGVALWLADNTVTFQPKASDENAEMTATPLASKIASADINSSAGAETTAAGSGTIAAGSDTIAADSGTIATGSGDSSASGVESFTFTATGASETVSGGAGVNVISVTGGDNLVFGGSAIDATSSIYTSDGADTVCSGYGDTTIWAGTGQQTVFGGASSASTSTLVSNSGSLTFVGGPGTDSIWLANGRSTVFGGSQHDNTATGSGDAIVVTGAGTSSLWLQTGTAAIFEDGSGAVLYGFLPNTPQNQGTDYIAGFTVGRDTLQVSSFGPGTAAELIADQKHWGGSTLLTLPDGTKLDLVGITSVDMRFFS